MLRHIMTYLINMGINYCVFFWGVHIDTYHASFSYFIHDSSVQKGKSFFDKLHFLLKPSWTWASKLRRISWVRLDPGVPHGRSPTEPQRHPVTKWLRTVVAMARKHMENIWKHGNPTIRIQI
jgi:hypothetical protein